LEPLDFREAVLERLRFAQGEVVVSTHASAGGGQIHIWNNMFEFSMIPGLPDSRNPS